MPAAPAPARLVVLVSGGGTNLQALLDACDDAAYGARVVAVAPEPEAILAAVTPQTRLLALSHALWTTGRVLPVRELREQTGVPVLVDGAQSVGTVPVDAAGLDFLTISGQKWLCGPDSTGALVVAEEDEPAPAQLDELRALVGRDPDLYEEFDVL